MRLAIAALCLGILILGNVAAQEFQPVSSLLTTGPYGGIPIGRYFIGGDAAGLKIIDVSNPAQPVVARNILLGYHVNGVQLRGGYLYVGNDRNGLLIFSIGDTLNPTLVGRCEVPGIASNPVLNGNYVYFRGSRMGNNIIITDISNPASPHVVTTLTMGQNVRSIAASGNYLYVCHDSDSLTILNVANPQSPFIAGGLSTIQYPRGISIVGNIMYIMEGGAGIEIFNILDPIHPAFLNSYDTPGFANGISVQGNYAYVADDTLLLVLNISNPSVPFQVGSLRVNAYWVIAFGNLAFASDGDIFLTINIANPTSPIALGEYLSPTIIGHISVADGRACATDDYYNRFKLWIADVSNPLAPIDASHYFEDVLGTYNIITAGGYVYIAKRDTGLVIFDITDPYEPTRIGLFNPIESVDKVYVRGNYAYLLSDSAKFIIVNVADRHSPVRLGSFQFSGGTNNAYVEGDYAYVCNETNGLQILNVMDLSNPQLAGTYIVPGGALSCTVRGDYAYIGASGLQIANISDPTHPTYVGSLIPETGGINTHEGIALLNNHVFATYGLGETTFVAAINVADPAHPELGDLYPLPWFIGQGIAVDGEYIYASCWLGILVFRFLPTGVFEEVGTIPTSARLSQCYPNPFNAKTTIEFALPAPSYARIGIFDIAGRQVAIAAVGNYPAGTNRIIWDAGELSSGIYFYRLQSGEFSDTQKMLLIK